MEKVLGKYENYSLLEYKIYFIYLSLCYVVKKNYIEMGRWLIWVYKKIKFRSMIKVLKVLEVGFFGCIIVYLLLNCGF